MKRSILIAVILISFVFAIKVSAAQDTQSPVIESVEVLTPKVEQGGTVKIKVKVSDDLSGVQKILVRFISSQTDLNFFTRVEKTAPLKGEYIIEAQLNEYAELGKWMAIQASVTDFAEKNGYYDTVGYGADLTPLVGASFEVVEKLEPSEKPIIDDGFKALTPQENVSYTKEFTIKFNMNISIKTITQGNIYVLNEANKRVPTTFIIDRNDSKISSEVTIAPLEMYNPRTTYTLYVKDIYSTSGKQLKQNTKMEFTTK